MLKREISVENCFLFGSSSASTRSAMKERYVKNS